ncbi:magnesium/cobalt transporter CorA [Candidatus Bathyarchaeota archaeon]|nr:MAG: magnesium/cobalt transporter CorA [Candidatus Bathyarchaeota archaeon]
MRRLIPRRSQKAGLAPGTIVHVGEKRYKPVKVSVINYNAIDFQEKEVSNVEEAYSLKDKSSVTWLNIDGVHKPEIIEQVGTHFGIHPLVLEDIANTGQRPKIDDFDEYIFVVLRMLRFDEKENETKTEQVSIVLGRDFVISFQELEGDVFDAIRERLRNNKGRIRKIGADYLAYTLIDAIVDNYFIILEKLGETIEDIEDKLVTNTSTETLRTIHDLKREMVFLRKSVWPLREVISRMERSESPLINKSTHIYLRDVYDHTIQVMDSVETFREMLSGMLDIYLSSVSNRMNEVMKVLTVIATIFIPLTFLAGIYGMNFRHMPELELPWSYPAILTLMFTVAILMVVYFRRKKWI